MFILIQYYWLKTVVTDDMKFNVSNSSYVNGSVTEHEL